MPYTNITHSTYTKKIEDKNQNSWRTFSRYQNLLAYKWNDRKVFWILSVILIFFLYPCAFKMFPFLLSRNVLFATYNTKCQTINFLATRQTHTHMHWVRYVKVLLVSSKVHCSFIRSNIVQDRKRAAQQNEKIYQLIPTFLKEKRREKNYERYFSIFPKNFFATIILQ